MSQRTVLHLWATTSLLSASAQQAPSSVASRTAKIHIGQTVACRELLVFIPTDRITRQLCDYRVEKRRMRRPAVWRNTEARHVASSDEHFFVGSSLVTYCGRSDLCGRRRHGERQFLPRFFHRRREPARAEAYGTSHCRRWPPRCVQKTPSFKQNIC
jgi:hypothetical protein